MDNSNFEKISGWNFVNSYQRLPEFFYSKEGPVAVKSPKLIIFNEKLADELGLDKEALMSKDGVEILAGNIVPKNAAPIAQAYAGHQFGQFTMLGDGRAIVLGEHLTAKDERFDIALKGAGRTKFSRGGDGRATLGPMLREYLISEAMHYLGIKTSRSLAVVETGEEVLRERPLAGAILTRVATSHLRVGTFEYALRYGTPEILKALADYAIERHFPMKNAAENKYLHLLRSVIDSQAKLIAKWQLAGFVHGVMNTDNMTISGETIDYGPCAFMDIYRRDTCFSSIDHNRRYSYGNQPVIGEWNLARFAEALIPLLDDDTNAGLEIAKQTLSEYSSLFNTYWLNGMRAKLGLFNEETGDQELIKDLLDIMEEMEADYTKLFRNLSEAQLSNDKIFETEAFQDWYARYEERLTRQEQTEAMRLKLMRNSNPSVIPRNHLVEEVLEQAVNHHNMMPFKEFLEVLNTPYAENVDPKYTGIPKHVKQPYVTYCGT